MYKGLCFDYSTPTGIRTRVAGMKILSPRPLDDRSVGANLADLDPMSMALAHFDGLLIDFFVLWDNHFGSEAVHDIFASIVADGFA